MPEISETLSDTTAVKSETPATPDAEAEINTEASHIVMVVLYENYAWSEEQEIKIIDSNGSYYYFDYEEGPDDSIWFDFDEDDWYNTLYDIAELGSVTELSDEEMNVILDFSEKYEEVSKNIYYKEYESTLRDYGSDFLYGIYNDGGKPKYVLLSQFGNGVKCLDDEDVINFANRMIDFGIFPTGHKNFKY
ncbi:MAG: hypothetical protein K2N72_08920 [Oscillospiraceae bacterium]|nr:hypothetical protein [Oscillospiraceae bacterium]